MRSKREEEGGREGGRERRREERERERERREERERERERERDKEGKRDECGLSAFTFTCVGSSGRGRGEQTDGSLCLPSLSPSFSFPISRLSIALSPSLSRFLPLSISFLFLSLCFHSLSRFPLATFVSVLHQLDASVSSSCFAVQEWRCGRKARFRLDRGLRAGSPSTE